jgi:hypothetical protein
MSLKLAWSGPVAVVLLSSCARGEPAPPAAPPPLASSAAAPDPPPGAEPSSSAGPSTPALLEPIGYTRVDDPPQGTKLAAPRFAPPEGASIPLRGAADGAVFARVKGGSVRVTLPPGAGRSAVVEAESDGVYLRGYLPPAPSLSPEDQRAAAFFHLRSAVAFGQVVSPVRGTGVAWAGARAGGITIALPPIRGLSFTGAPPTIDVPSNDVSLTATSYEAGDALPRGAPRRAAYLPLGTAVPVAPSRDGAPAASITAGGPGSSRVDVRAEDGARAQIAWQSPSALVVGWVDAKALAEAPGLGADGLDLGGIGHGSGKGRLTPEDVICDKDVGLLVDVSPRESNQGVRRLERYSVGKIKAGTRVLIQRRREGFTHVMMWRTMKDVDVSMDASWLVPSSDLAGCKAVPVR